MGGRFTRTAPRCGPLAARRLVPGRRLGFAAVLLAIIGCVDRAPLLAQSGTLEVHSVPSSAIAANLLGESSDIEVAVYTPPGYETSGLEYPVLYLLHGISGTYRDWTEGGYQGLQIHDELDGLIASGDVPPMVVVMPTAMNRYLGSFYVDSPVTGGWGEFMSRELVAWVDSNYRTIESAGGRGIAGHSMGGFGALVLPMTYPGAYSAAYAISPCCLALAGDLGATNSGWPTALAFDSSDDIAETLQQGQFYPVAIMGILSVATPNENRPPFYVDPPFQPDGRGFLSRVEPAHSRYRDFFLIERLDEHVAALSGLRGLVIDTGHDDQFTHIPTGARAFSSRLAELDVPHTFELYDGDHRNRMRVRINEIILPFFAKHLDRAR